MDKIELKAKAAKVVEMSRSLIAEFGRVPNCEISAQVMQDIIELGEVSHCALAGVYSMSVHVPLDIAESVGGDCSDDAIKVAALSLIMESAIYVLDHIVDSEWDDLFEVAPKSVLLLGCIDLIIRLPLQAVVSLFPAKSVELQGYLLEAAHLMNAGQIMDVAERSVTGASVVNAERAALLKSGVRRRLYVSLAACVSGARDFQLQALGNYGLCLGTARQIRSDILDLTCAAESRDLSSGALTLPIVLHFSRQGKGSLEVKGDLASAKSRAERIALLKESGALRESIVRREQYCKLALNSLENASCLSNDASLRLRQAVLDVRS